MNKIKVLSNNETQKEFETRLNYIINNENLKNRKERIYELSKMYTEKGYYIPEKIAKKIEKLNLI